MAANEALPSPAADALRARDRVSTRIVVSSLTALLVVLSMVGWTLWLSWQLEGAAAAINDTGSLRMRANRIGVELLLQGPSTRAAARDDMLAMDDTLGRLQHGVPSRPLFLPDDAAIRAQMARVRQTWQAHLRPATMQALAGAANTTYLAALPGFVSQADQLVSMIETDSAGKTALLRLSQAVLLGLSCLGTVAMIYLLYLWIISPVLRLQDGLRSMAARQFGTRLSVETRDEFGAVAQGFNRMADELEGLYHDLEGRVRQKTAQLAQQNRELSALYDMAAFLNQPSDIDTLCHGFLKRVMAQFDADGGSIRVIDPSGQKLHLVASEGLSAELEDTEHCMKVDACFCGTATNQGVVVIRDFRRLPQPETFHCSKEGFKGLAVFRVVTQDEVLGSFSLHFRHTHEVPAAEAHLLETLGQHLGVALDNRRLGAKARELAIASERNLVAQGLHDSIAQGLNFLNLQVQMLAGAAAQGKLEDLRDIVPLLRAGIDESYQDVRELLLNFRSKLGQGQLRAAIDDTVARFRRQSGIEVTLVVDEHEGAPLPPEQQLQVLFILQEALSNVRKHAQAASVSIEVRNGRDFEMHIRDDGAGFDPAEVAGRGEKHLGLHIMQERATRLNASLAFDASPGGGTAVHLVLPRTERRVA